MGSQLLARIKNIFRILNDARLKPKYSRALFRRLPFILRGDTFGGQFQNGKRESVCKCAVGESSKSNPILTYFKEHAEGRGIHKWSHYFDAYHRHFSKFVGEKVNVMEIGVYSGGSLKMWREYLGDRCFVYGVDITTECKAYEDEWTKIYIGDQEDRAFWRTFKSEGIELDIVIDDGGHTPEQQIATLEEMLPFLKHGGVYVCEDAHGELHEFNAYLFGLSQHLHTYDMYASDKTSGDFCHASAFQSEVHSIHIYPYMTVIEKNECCIPTLSGPRRGTLWNPVYAGKPDIAPELLSEKGAEGPSD